MGLVTVLVYGLLVWVRRTRRSTAALWGIMLILALYMVAEIVGLRLTVAVLRGFVAVALIAVIVMFQAELRDLFERVARFPLRHRQRRERGYSDIADVLVPVLIKLAARRVGALVVLAGSDDTEPHLSGGQQLDGHVTAALVESIFDPHSAGHDGAVLVRGGRIVRFACHLPLTRNHEALGGRGTRHAAALGLSERCDALILIVSEEAGSISLVRHGQIQAVAGEAALHSAIATFNAERLPSTDAPWWGRVRGNWREKLLALVLASGLWFALVHSNDPVSRNVLVPVLLTLPPAMEVKGGHSPVTATVSGPRKVFYFLRNDSVTLVVDARELVLPGQHSVKLKETDFRLPAGVELVAFRPRDVSLELVTLTGSEAE